MSSGKSIFRMLLLLLAVAVALPLIACETPVYRYAMYRWAPAPFEVYFFHSGELSEDDKELHAEMLSIAQDDESPLNCSLISVDLEKDPGETTDLSGSNRRTFREMAGAMREHIQRGGAVPWQKP